MTKAKLNLNNIEDIREYLINFNIANSRAEGEEYLNTHLKRIMFTIDLLQKTKGKKVLELGSAPVYMSILMKELGYEVTHTCLAEDDKEKLKRATYINNQTKDRYDFEFYNFNVEKERFPFADGEFDVVLCCEIIEHLVENPVNMLSEIHRILKKGGSLILTTPNILSTKNVFSLITGRNIYHPYSLYGVYGRHNREFSVDELKKLLTACNFEMDALKVVSFNNHAPPILENVTNLFSKVFGRNGEDCIFIVAKARGQTNYPLPSYLFMIVSNPKLIKKKYPNAPTKDYIRMGENDTVQLGEGWYELENWPPNIRWTREEASALLRKSKDDKFVIVRLCTHQNGAEVLIKANGSEKKFSINKGWNELKMPIAGGEKEDLEVTIKMLTPLLHIPWGRELGIAVERMWLTKE